VSGPKRVGDLEIDSDVGFQQREWRFERVGWVAMLLVAFAALAGAFGRGPLSKAEAGGGGPLRVRYERFARHNSPAALELEVAAVGAADSTVRVWFDHEYLSNFDLQHIIPEPETAEASPARTTYVFRVSDPSRPARITFGLVPQGVGRLRGQVGLPGAPPVELSQFIFP
jgi:hypothetical protein